LIVAGVMSGTSADGVDVALVRLTGRGLRTRFELVAHHGFRYPAKVRRAVLEAMNSQAISVAELSRLNFLLAELYAECVRKTEGAAGVQCELVGCHGQTIYHQGRPAKYLGRNIACTFQLGDGSVLAARLGRPVITDFRPADIAAGGQGAPLVPFLDVLAFRHAHRGRIVLNIGGIGNLTAIPAAARAEDVHAFDTGPGNMVMDALSEKLFGLPYDRSGRMAARGHVLDSVLAAELRHPFFRRRGARSTGREEFGRHFAEHFLVACGKAAPQDVMTTATALTARSIGQSLRTLLRQHKYHDLFVSGGGTRNHALMAMLTDEATALGLTVAHTDVLGIPSQAKEALAFAVLAYQTWRGEPSNVPAATGARRLAILGKVSRA
jgi:anhydro-N-acetylmuramic acid kinase